MKIRKIMAAFLSAAMVVTSAAIPVFADEDAPIDSGAYEEDIELAADVDMPTDSWSTVAGEAEPGTDYVVDEATGNVEIKTALGLAWLAQQVNDGDTYSNKTVTLSQSVNLRGRLWTPIGNDTTAFSGTFIATNDAVISGIRINATEGKQGLFGKINAATLTDVAIDDVVIVTTSNYAGVLMGQMTSSSSKVTGCKISDAEVTVNYPGWNYGYAGGITGQAYQGTIDGCTLSDSKIHNLSSGGSFTGGVSGAGYGKLSNCTVEHSTIESVDWKVGGIMGQHEEGNSTYSGMTVDGCIIRGASSVGGISGFANYTNANGGKEFKDCKVLNTTFEPYGTRTTLIGAGGILGSLSPSSGHYGVVTFNNCEVSGCTFKGNTISNSGPLLGQNYWRSVKTTDKVITLNNATINDVNFECTSATNIGSLYGEPFYATGSASSNYTIEGAVVTDVTINENPENTLYIMGTNYPDGTVSFDKDSANVDFGPGNKIPSDLTPFENDNQKVVQDPETGEDIVMNWENEELALPEEIDVKLNDDVNAEVKAFEDNIMEEYRQEVNTEGTEGLPEGTELFFHVVTELEVKTSDPVDGVYTVTVNPTYKILASNVEGFNDSEGREVKSGEFEISNSVDVTLTLPTAFAKEGDYISITHKHIHDGEEILHYYTSKVDADNSVTFKSEYGFSSFEFTVAAGPELTGLGLEEDEGFTFDPKIKAYTATVSGTTETATITATAADGYEISIEGKKVNSGDSTSIALKPGRNVITVTVSEGDVSTTYTITITREISNSVKVTFDQPSGYAKNRYDIYINAGDENIINRLSTADLTFVNKPDDDADIAYTIAGTEDVSVINAGKDRYEFNFNGVKEHDSGAVTKVKIGEVTFSGIGTGKFGVKTDEATNAVHAAAGEDNIVTDYIAGGGAGVGTLEIADVDTADPATDDGVIEYTLSMTKKDLTINVQFPNEVLEKDAAYTKMTVALHSALDSVDTVDDAPIKLGSELGDAYKAASPEGYAQYTVETSVMANTRYTATFTGDGYRTYSVDFIIPESAENENSITVWNNFMDENHTVVKVNGEAVTADDTQKTFLAGDIDNTQKIDLYDLSAAVAYFGKTGMADEDKKNAEGKYADDAYIRYDLNRDGNIDSKDIAMVLVSWGN